MHRLGRAEVDEMEIASFEVAASQIEKSRNFQ